MDLEVAIADALARRAEYEQAAAREREIERGRAQHQTLDRFITDFGVELVQSLNAQPDAIDAESVWIAFVFRGRMYRTYPAYSRWKVTRWDDRADGDWRIRPVIEVYPHDNDHAVSDFLLALADLDARPAEPRQPFPEPSDADEPGPRLLEALRVFLQSEL